MFYTKVYKLNSCHFYFKSFLIDDIIVILNSCSESKNFSRASANLVFEAVISEKASKVWTCERKKRWFEICDIQISQCSSTSQCQTLHFQSFMVDTDILSNPRLWQTAEARSSLSTAQSCERNYKTCFLFLSFFFILLAGWNDHVGNFLLINFLKSWKFNGIS